jgi:hypothetical protein
MGGLSTESHVSELVLLRALQGTDLTYTIYHEAVVHALTEAEMSLRGRL